MSNRSINDLETEREKWALPRRDFLVLGSAAVVCAATSSVASATVRAIASPVGGAVLSVGYAEPTEGTDSGNSSRLIAAQSLRLADRGFDRNGARVTVHGLWRPEARETAPASIRFSTFAPNAAPFLAWSYSLDAKGRSIVSPRASFTAALHADGTLPFAVERNVLHAAPSRRLGGLLSFARSSAASNALPELAKLEQQKDTVCRLSSGERGDARLRPGMYFIALRESSSQPQPDWSSVLVDRSANDLSAGVLSRHGRPVAFEYIALSVDYAAV
ncbi:MAG TPA: hypothetical protein VGQ76_24700 [Thermoanaerobaculia bacterium]|jgi:hypothetical protein|nr:hypothetical protein [Thermoanaerobaculia bacterium]